jgi:quinoprotein glucose dehydrogenase
LRGNGTYPSLVDITTRVGADTVRSTVSGGKGPMPSFGTDIKEADMNNLVAYLANPKAAGGPGARGGESAQEEAEKLGGPVVASGGSPAGQAMAKAGAGVRGSSPYGQMGGPPYPEGVDAPAERYYTGYNIMGNIIKPPYSTLTAYDLNKGTIKWQVPVGDDLRAVQEGAHGTGAIGIRVGMVTTSTGLVFLAGGDMKIRAYDQETGKVVWTANLPGQSHGFPSMYEAGGRQYLVVNATSPPGPRDPVTNTNSAQPRGYIAFALPEKSSATQ